MSTNKEDVAELFVKIERLVPDEVDILLERLGAVLNTALDDGGDGTLIGISIPLGVMLHDYERIAEAIRLLRNRTSAYKR